MTGIDLDTTIRQLETVLADLRRARDQIEDEAAADNQQGEGEGEFAEWDLLDSATAGVRFRTPPDTIRKWCRVEGMGVKRGGRWLVSISRLKARLGF